VLLTNRRSAATCCRSSNASFDRSARLHYVRWRRLDEVCSKKGGARTSSKTLTRALLQRRALLRRLRGR
jgi:hypothetical protein